MFLILSSASAQDTIYWNSQRPLAWEDFKAMPEARSNESAQAATGVALEFRFRENLIDNTWEYQYKVHSYFLTKLSWVKLRSANYYLLEHEQTHFNISELYARKLRKVLSELEASETVGEEAERKYNSIQKEHAKIQNKYDKESKHSLHIEKELEWQERIIDSLKKYDDWK